MPFPILTALSVTAGLGLLQYQRQKSKPVPLVERLASRLEGAQPTAPLQIGQRTQDDPLSATQHLALSAGLLGMNTIAVLGFPWLRLLSLPGLVYINFHFLRLAYHSWQRTRRVTIAINDAVLANLLLLTGQLDAGALFATFFFVSQKLQQTTNNQLAYLANPSTAAVSSSADKMEATPQWQQSIDQGALPMLALSVVTAPFLGVQRSASVLLANFGYDYRVLAPLTSLSYLQIAAEQGIFVRDEQVFDRLRAVDLILVDACLDDLATSLYEAAASESYTVQRVPCAVDAIFAEIKQQQAQGRRVAYITAQPASAVDGAWVNVLVCRVETAVLTADATPDAHVVLSPGTPAQAQTLMALTEQRRERQKQNFVLALTPSLVNLWGIFFMRFSPVTALIVDYGGMGLGVLNAVWPRLKSSDLAPSPPLLTTRTNGDGDETSSTPIPAAASGRQPASDP